MFNLTPKETFKEEVKIPVKTDTGWREESFIGTFLRTPESRREELAHKPFHELVDEVLVGWEMKDLDRKPVEFTPENKAAFLEIAGAARETSLAYLRANTGAKPKN